MEASLASRARRYVKRALYGYGPTRRLSYNFWTPGERETALGACRSLIHVGANEGHERFIYEFMGLDVLWVEPIPNIFLKLENNIRGFQKQKAVKALLSDKAGATLRLNISNNDGLSSSIFDLADHRLIWPDVHYVDHIECRTVTLDELLLHSPSPDALVLDTQGSELMVLAGGERTLCHARTVKVEAADFQSYAGGCTHSELVDFLTARGFKLVDRRCFAHHPKLGGYFDLVFSRI